MFKFLSMFKVYNDWDQKKYDDIISNNLDSVTTPSLDDGATEIESANYNMHLQSAFNYNDNSIKSTKDLINQYRGLMNNYEVDNAVDEIVNDAIVYEIGHDVVKLNLDDTEFSESIKTKIQDEFKLTLNALKFQTKGSDHFRRWYVDSRMYFHKIINPAKPKDGIHELRRLDPKNVKFIREVQTDMMDGVKIVKGYKEYFLYELNESYNTFDRSFLAGDIIKIPASAITYAHSGLLDCSNTNIIGYLHRAVKPANQLKMLEDSMVIYRITRAPDRRVFYIDTGNMPAKRASQYMQNIINSFKNRVVYDSTTGKIKNQKTNMSLTEDFWLQRRDGKAVTDVDTLPGMTGMSEFDDVLYFRKALYMALRVPLSRIPDEQNGQIQFDQGTAISRDELRFDKFIVKLQHQFSPILLDPLKTNLLLKNILSEDDWDDNANDIKIDFHRDSYWSESKDAELDRQRVEIFQQFEPYIGKVLSWETAQKKYLGMTDDDIKQEKELITKEMKDPIYKKEDDEYE